MERAPGEYQPEFSFVHGMNNKLSVIVGTCDLLIEKMPEGSPLLQKMSLIRDTAKSMAAEIDKFRDSLPAVKTPNRRRREHRAQTHC